MSPALTLPTSGAAQSHAGALSSHPGHTESSRPSCWPRLLHLSLVATLWSLNVRVKTKWHAAISGPRQLPPLPGPHRQSAEGLKFLRDQSAFLSVSLCFAHFITLTGWGQPLQYSAWFFHVPGRLRGLPTGSCSRGLCKPVPSKSLTFFLPISPFDAKNPFLAAVTTNRKLNQGTERHLMHLELDISESKIRYLPPPVSPADSLALSPLCASS